MENEQSVSTYPQLLADLLQRHVGQGVTMSVDALAAAVPMKGKTLYAIRAGDLTPSFDLAMRIVRCLPDAAAAEFFAGLGFHGLARSGTNGSLHDAHYELGRTNLAYTDFLRDGLLDHREQRILKREFLPRLQAAVARCMGASR